MEIKEEEVLKVMLNETRGRKMGMGGGKVKMIEGKVREIIQRK